MHEKMYREFVEELCQYYNEDTKLPLANEDIRYALDLQKKRLEHQNVSMRLHYTLRGEWMDKVCTRKFQDLKYTNDLTWTWLEKDVSYLINDETKLKVKQKEILYTIITDLKSKNIQDKIICPNCGNIINLNELVEHGCSFCKTHFMMSDLFPCITNYYAIKDLGMNDKEVKRKIGLFAIIGAVAVNAINFPFLMITFQEYGIFLTVLYMILLSVAGGIASYFVLSISLLIKVFKEAISSIPLVASQTRAKRKLPELMKKYDPAFSFEYFMGRVQSLLKVLVFSEDMNHCAVYDGETCSEDFKNIVDTQFAGAIGLERFEVKDQYCYVDLKVYMQDIYLKNNDIRKKAKVYKVGLCKNISKPTDYGFSIKKVNCQSCGASFDATKEKYCPYCNSEYHLKDEDWVITYIR